jgi:hypothetical protein
MSIKLVAEEVRRFLESPDPEVICLMGKWGVGKTFAWNRYLQEAASENAVALKRYSYVTLFGQNALEDLKYAIFETTSTIDQLGSEPDDKTFQEAISFLERMTRKGTTLIGYIPKVKEFAPLLSRGFFLAVRNQIICIDDLERVGGGLAAQDILGLISFLKEQRKCKVILLLNDEELSGDAADVFKIQLEKVIDVAMRFEPTPREAASIGVDPNTAFHEKLASVCISLGIVNIRVIRKIQRLLKRLRELLVNHDPRVFEAALPSVVLFGWAVYQPKLAPSLDFFMNKLDPMAHLLKKKEKPEEEQAGNWRLLLSGIGVTHFDEFDKALLQSVQRGYFDPEEIEKAATDFDKRLEHQDKDSSFSHAWKKFHSSLGDDSDEVLDEMYISFKSGLQAIGPQNLDGTLGLFRKMGRDKEADEMIDLYMKERKEDRDFYDPSRSVFLSLKDANLAKAFADRLSSFQDTRDPKDILIKIARSSGWNPEDITTLAAVSADEYYKLFKENKGDNLRIIVSQALKFGQYHQSEPGYRQIAANAEEALKRIARESDMNRLPVETYGITLDNEDE